MPNITSFKIDQSNHAIIGYVNEAGERVMFDLTEHVEAVAKMAADEAVTAHERKFHGHQL